MGWWNALGVAKNIWGIGASSRGRRKAYEEARRETPADIKYRERLEKASLEGDPDLHKKKMQSYRPIVSQGERAIASTTGTAIRQGLENSIIAGEMKSRVNAKTLQALTEVADRIANYNEEYKDRAELDLERYNMQREARLRDLAVGYKERPNDIEALLGEIATWGGMRNLWNTDISDEEWINRALDFYTGKTEK